MNKPTTVILSCIALAFLSGCAATNLQWETTQHYDEFTNTKICRVMKGTQGQRDFNRAFMVQAYGAYFHRFFYAENYNGEIRAGVRTEPPLPISGDIQINIAEKLYTMTSADTPVDLAPTISIDTTLFEKTLGTDYADNMQAMIKNIQGAASPYRAYTGKKALQLLRDVAKSEGEIKFRIIGVNQALSTTGTFTSGKGFVTALKKCGIDL